MRWLDDREAKSEETVTLAQFCDMLMNKPGVSREDAIRVRISVTRAPDKKEYQGLFRDKFSYFSMKMYIVNLR